MAYNLQSLITILEQILNPQQTRWILDHNKPQLESLYEKAASLQQILEKSSFPKIESLESQMRDAAHKAEDMIEPHMVDQMLFNPSGVRFTFSTPDLQQVTQQLDSIMEQVVKLVEENKMSSGASSSSGAATLLQTDLSSKSVVVGVDEDLMQLKDRLTGTQSKLEIIPIVGMGGVGKTTLAQKLYQDPSILDHFQFRAWTTISQDYNMRKILLSLLRCIIGKETDEEHIEKGNDELKLILHKTLFGRRYMIVLDDIWTTQAWDDIKAYFPNNNNGSRIVLTTRDSDVAKYADSKSLQHQVQLLTKSESWNLLRQIVFGEEKCPHFLLEIGEKIASDCGGLPLAINVIGGILSKLERSKDVWKNIATDVRAALAESGEQFSNILCLSYNHLPNHLRPCFLYMGAFPEDYEIKSPKLIHLWIAEGFVKSKGDKTLEEEAKDYLNALVERNLILVKEKKITNGKPKRFIIHDLLRDLFIQKADEEKFLHVKKSPEVTFSNPRRVSVHTSYGSKKDAYASAKSMSLARSFLSTKKEILSPFFSALRMLRVLDVKKKKYSEFPQEILQLANLRYLAISCSSGLPSEISRLCNLQTLIAKIGSGRVPFEIWEMSELRHLKLNKSILMEDKDMKKFVQNKLQAISTVVLSPSLIRFGFFESIPDIKDLRIHCEVLLSSAVDLTHLHSLETLRYKSGAGSPGRGFLSTFIFPSTLRKLTLIKCDIFPRALTTLCGLPNLEVLKIEECVFESKEGTRDQVWEMAEEGDEFRSLQFLHLYSSKLVRWRADATNFPRLRHLLLDFCCELEEIPIDIGDISTLQLIRLNGCSDSADA